MSKSLRYDKNKRYLMNTDLSATFAKDEDEINFVKGRFDHYSDIEK
jgi:hypothetical protein